MDTHKGPSKISVQAAGPIKDTPRRCKKYTPQRRYRTPSVPVAFDSDRCRHEIARMIILHDYPLHMVEHKGFMTFVHNLQPKFNMVDFSTVQGDCVATYLREKSTIEGLIEAMPGPSELKEEFSRLDTLYLDYFKIPSGEDWNLIQLELTCASTSEDNIISTITKPMLEGFDKYWKSNCFVLAIAIVMDPRFKMKLVDFSFAKIFGDEAASYINIVDEGIHQLFLDYAAGDVTGYLSNGDGHGLGNTYFDDFIMESASQQSKSELDQYLEESLLPRSHEFEVMRWWKLNEPKYPTLSKMAHDILTLPVSTVDPESVFDTAL
ncbi:zinc finger BED domain-containing protein DAYSLEEPER-like protein [Tanacetum coccineum]